MSNANLNEFFLGELSSRAIEKIVLNEPSDVTQLPTPALLLDIDQLAINQKLMVEAASASGLSLRSHAKMHKCPEVAKFQLAHGSSGICCAKVSEAHIMQHAGVSDILITSPVQHPSSLDHVVHLARTNPELKIVLDSEEGARKLNQRLIDQSLSMTILIDIDPGLGRTGISADERLLNLFEYIESQCDQLRFGGLQVYAGHCMHIVDYETRISKYQRAMAHGERGGSITTKNVMKAERNRSIIMKRPPDR